MRSGYGSVEILHGITLRVATGRIVALLGPNGAGKSTLVQTIAGILPCNSGTITIDGTPLTRMPAHRRLDMGLAVVPEGRALFRTMSVRDNLILGGRGDRSGLDHIVEVFPELSTRLSQVAGTLSGGQQQMLAIGRALMSRPRFLVLDEPSLGLAPLIVTEILAQLPVLASEGTGVLLVEQNALQALDVADTAVIIERGTAVADRPAAEMRNDVGIIDAYLGGMA